MVSVPSSHTPNGVWFSVLGRRLQLPGSDSLLDLAVAWC